MGNNNSYQNNYNYNMDVTSITDDETLVDMYTLMYMANEWEKFLQKNGEWIGKNIRHFKTIPIDRKRWALSRTRDIGFTREQINKMNDEQLNEAYAKHHLTIPKHEQEEHVKHLNDFSTGYATQVKQRSIDILFSRLPAKLKDQFLEKYTEIAESAKADSDDTSDSLKKDTVKPDKDDGYDTDDLLSWTPGTPPDSLEKDTDDPFKGIPTLASQRAKGNWGKARRAMAAKTAFKSAGRRQAIRREDRDRKERSATRLQALVRGRRFRQMSRTRDIEEGGGKGIELPVPPSYKESSDLRKSAASRIQALQRGRRSRKVTRSKARAVAPPPISGTYYDKPKEAELPSSSVFVPVKSDEPELPSSSVFVPVGSVASPPVASPPVLGSTSRVTSSRRSRKCSRGFRKGTSICKKKPGRKRSRRSRKRRSRSRKCSRGFRKGSRICRRKPGPKRSRRSRRRRSRRRRSTSRRSRKCSRGFRKGSRVCRRKPGPKRSRRSRRRRSRKCSRGFRKGSRVCRRKPGPRRSRS